MFVLDSSLTDLAVRCWPDGCPRAFTCCEELAVEVSPREVRAIDGLMDELACRLPALRLGNGRYANVFVDEDPPDLLIEPREDGSCPFLKRTAERSLCTIHQLALETNRAVPAVKPAACRHWPVTLEQEGPRVRVLVQPAAGRIGCVAPRGELPGQPSVLAAYREEIVEICGDAVRPLLERKLRADARRVRSAAVTGPALAPSPGRRRGSARS